MVKMKILYFHQHFSTPQGSAGIRSYGMARALAERGHEVAMVCGSYSGGETGLSMPFRKGLRRGFVHGIEVIEFDLSYSNMDGFIRRSFLFFKFAMRSTLLALFEKYDVLFATTTPLTAGIPGIFARWLRRKPFVFEVRDLWPELPRAMGVVRNPLVLWGMSLLEWLSYRSAHRLIGLSPGIVEGITKRGVQKKKIRLVPNGCDLDIFDNPAKPWRPDSVLATDLMAVFTGTHGRANGLDAVLGVAQELQRRKTPGVKLVLIGQGSEKSRLQSQAAKEGLSNLIFCDPVDKASLAGLLASADIGLQILANVPAFYYGTSPNKFFDYIASGLPVLNNYPGWLADLITEKQCGFAVPPDDACAFADALEFSLINKEALEEMGRQSLKLAQAQFDRKKLGEEWVDWVSGASE
jgi:glycosyltransferase involved in cell wall biosynthesis